MADIEGGMFGDKEYFKPIVDAVHNMKVRAVCNACGVRSASVGARGAAAGARREDWRCHHARH